MIRSQTTVGRPGASRLLPAMLAMLTVLMVGCAQTPKTGTHGGDASRAGEGGGYLAEGPTVHLEDARNPEFASPLEALAQARRERDEAIARADELERELEAAVRRAQRFEENGDALRHAAVDAEGALERERAVQREMASALADLRIRTVELEQELFRLKVRRLTSLEAELAEFERAKETDDTNGDSTSDDSDAGESTPEIRTRPRIGPPTVPGESGRP